MGSLTGLIKGDTRITRSLDYSLYVNQGTREVLVNINMRCPLREQNDFILHVNIPLVYTQCCTCDRCNAAIGHSTAC